MLELAGYSDLRPFHRGQRSLVLRARRNADDLPVVIKTTAADYPSARDLNRLRHEFEIGRALARGPAHAYAVRHLELAPVGAGFALVSEDFGGRSLRDEFTGRSLSLERFVDLALAAARAIAAVHETRLLHLDINPSNVLCHPDTRELRLCDFSAGINLESAARTPRFQGTPAYASPEQTLRTGRSVDHRADLYSLGVTLFELLTGKLPFSGGDTLETFHRHLSEAPPSARDARPDVPWTLSALLLKLLNKDPDERYRSAHGLCADLLRCQQQLCAHGVIASFELASEDRSPHFSLPQRVYGREREFKALAAHFERCRSGEVGFLLVSGEAGVGKSTLVARLREHALASGAQFFMGKFEPPRQGPPYAAFSTAFRAFLHGVLTRPSAELRRWRERILGALGPNAALLIRHVPDLERLLGPQPEPPVLEPEQAQARFRHLILNLIDSMALADSPLVIFLDDLQWADLASTDLIEQLMSAGRLHHLMLVGAHRDGEPDGNHPVSALIERLSGRTTFLELALQPLDVADVARLVADSLQCSAERSLPLSRMVWQKTRGNPFFVGQFLRTIHGERWLEFDPNAREWTWDLDACAAQVMTDNVIDLMVGRIHRIAPVTEQVLRHAACIGREFDVELLASVLSLDEPSLDAALTEALDAELIAGIDAAEGPGDAVPARFRFVHDQMLQAAYGSMPAATRAEIHLALGRKLYTAYGAQQREERIFQLVDHLSLGLPLVSRAAERLEFAPLYLTAGRRAKSANAYGAAGSYFRCGLELLGPDGFRDAHELSLQLHREYAETCYLAGNFAEMSKSCAELIGSARTLLERVPAFQLELTAHITRNELPRSLALAREVLALLGVELPSRVSQARVALRVLGTNFFMRGDVVEGLLARPKMTDPRALAAMQILAQVSTPAYLTSPNLFPLVVCEMLALTLEYGPCEWSADALIGWGAIQLAGFNKIERGYQIGSCAPRLIELLGAAQRRGRTQAIYNLVIRHWREPLRATVEPLAAAVQGALDHGDLAYASIAAVTHVFYMLMSGHPLAEVEERALALEKRLAPLGQQRFRRDMARVIQLVRCLAGRAPDPKRLRGEFFDDEQALRASEEETDRAAIASLGYERGLLLYVYGDFLGALECCRNAAGFVDSVLGTVYSPALEFLSALVRARVLTDHRAQVSPRTERRKIRKSLSRLQAWAEAAPSNHRHRVELIRAELARLAQNDALAVKHYEQAIELAHRHGYLNELAMSLECAGRFYVGLGQTRVAATTILAARDAWSSYGAAAKAALLDSEFSQLLSPLVHAPRSLPAAINAHDERAFELLDVASIMKACQAIVGEIRLPGLVRRLLKLAIENTGAQRGFLFLNVDGQLELAASADVDERDTPSRLASGVAELEPQALLPMSVVDYVARLGQPLLEVNVSASALFAHDPYIAEQRPLSVLCVPLVSQGSVSGVVYLENNRMRGAFSAERVQVLGLLSALSAISLDNATLYEDAKRAHRLELERSRAQARFVPAEFLRSLNKDSIVDVQLGDNIRKEMSVLFSDVRGFTRLVEGMSPQDHIGFINGYLGHMESAIVDAGGFVDSYLGDGIMALFEGDPDFAVRAAVAMSVELGRFNRGWQASGHEPIAMGVGLSTGALTLGTIGGASRIKCGVIGDTVNLASRIESLTKLFDCFALISQDTRDRLREPERFDLRRVDRVRVSGKTQPITLFEVLDAEPPARRDAKRRSHAAFQAALDAYFAGHFADAAAAFDACSTTCPDDGAALRLCARARRHQRERPPDWDGISALTEK
ncbi:MAG TPA: AAA family ATPase [Polyangiaceae bacterium]|jgi:predicted ATPase/class 3 adenylate cyclase